jgi:hypothetical protein
MAPRRAAARAPVRMQRIDEHLSTFGAFTLPVPLGENHIVMSIRIRLSRESVSHWLLWRCSRACRRQQLIRNRSLNIAAFARELAIESGCIQSAEG